MGSLLFPIRQGNGPRRWRRFKFRWRLVTLIVRHPLLWLTVLRFTGRGQESQLLILTQVRRGRPMNLLLLFRVTVLVRNVRLRRLTPVAVFLTGCRRSLLFWRLKCLPVLPRNGVVNLRFKILFSVFKLLRRRLRLEKILVGLILIIGRLIIPISGRVPFHCFQFSDR